MCIRACTHINFIEWILSKNKSIDYFDHVSEVISQLERGKNFFYLMLLLIFCKIAIIIPFTTHCLSEEDRLSQSLHACASKTVGKYMKFSIM